MSDPAVEAARRARMDGRSTHVQRVAAAREALAPIRELHRRLDRSTLPYSVDDRVVCNHCLGPIDWPCATAVLVYAEEELS